jgi:hypothetical protein
MVSIRQLLLSLFTVTLSANNSTYNPCFQKNSQSIYTLSGVDCLAVESHRLICHDPLLKMKQLPKGYRELNYDPFTRTYDVRSTKKLNPVKFKGLAKIASGTELALIDKGGYRVGKIKSYANGFDRFGEFGLDNTLGKVLGAKCYTVVGIGTIKNRYIPSEFIQSFIGKGEASYGDIGVRFKQKGRRYIVTKRDVYFPDNPFEVGDEIVKLNGKRYDRMDAFSFAILFAKPGTPFDVSIRRDGSLHRVKVISGQRYGGGYLTDTFLERFGLIFDKALVVQKVQPGSFAARKGIKPGDRILEFDGTPIKTINALTERISKKRLTHTSILFDRNDFQFFFTIY